MLFTHTVSQTIKAGCSLKNLPYFYMSFAMNFGDVSKIHCKRHCRSEVYLRIRDLSQNPFNFLKQILNGFKVRFKLFEKVKRILGKIPY